MSFRYKSALLSLVSMAGVYGWFFATLLIHAHGGGPFNVMGHLVGAIVALTVIQIVGNILIAGTSSDKFGAPDERERAFDRRATMVGYYVLIVGAFAAIATLHIGFDGPMIAHGVLLAVVVAECTRQPRSG
jgi:hypothetical protein